MLFFFPRDVLIEIWDLIESVYEGFPTYSLVSPFLVTEQQFGGVLPMFSYVNLSLYSNVIMS